MQILLTIGLDLPPLIYSNLKSQFDTVVTHLASFVDKGWQIESLTEKLCVFLGEATSEPQQGRKLAKCLAALKEESRGTLKLAASFEVYQHALLDVETGRTMSALAARCVKGLGAESKHRLSVEEWAAKVDAVLSSKSPAAGEAAEATAAAEGAEGEAAAPPATPKAAGAAAAPLAPVEDAENVAAQ